MMCRMHYVLFFVINIKKVFKECRIKNKQFILTKNSKSILQKTVMSGAENMAYYDIDLSYILNVIAG